MTEPSQDVTFGVVTPSLPAVPVVRPGPSSVTGLRTSDCATEQALHVAAKPSCVSTTSSISTSVHDLTSANTSAKPAEPPSSLCLQTKSDSKDHIKSQENLNILVEVDEAIKTRETASDFNNTSDIELHRTSPSNQNEANTTIESPFANTSEINVKETSRLIQSEEYSIHSPIQDSEGNLSVSTDETLHNSDSDSFTFANKGCSTLHFFGKDKSLHNFENGEKDTKIKMGNQQSDKKSRQSDDDTPDESKTKCCEIPKKKVKDRYSKATSRSSKSGEDYDFEDDELYPFESRTRSEHEIVDPVELEPFEIIETDDIKFIPGAGTSDVIKSASESKFKTIPEEESIDGDEKFDTFIIKHDRHHRPPDKEVVVINKGEVFLEPGTSTAHSTFEFKPVKARPKAAKKQPEEKAEPTYENIQAASSVSVGSSKTNSSSSSNDASRKNSKEGIQKPTRQKSKKRSDSSASDQDSKEKIEKSKKTISKQTKEKESTDETQTGNKALILTQTMFSTPNPQEKGDKPKVLNESNVPQNTYQNINVGVKFGPHGITICNTSPEPNTDTRETTIDNTTTEDHKETALTKSDAFLGSPNLSENIGTESPLYETLTPEVKGQNTSDSDIVTETFQNRDENKTADSGKTESGGIDSTVIPEHVPPPSPLALDILEEEMRITIRNMQALQMQRTKHF